MVYINECDREAFDNEEALAHYGLLPVGGKMCDVMKPGAICSRIQCSDLNELYRIKP